jgi:hypothetical protein
MAPTPTPGIEERRASHDAAARAAKNAASEAIAERQRELDAEKDRQARAIAQTETDHAESERRMGAEMCAWATAQLTPPLAAYFADPERTRANTTPVVAALRVVDAEWERVFGVANDGGGRAAFRLTMAACEVVTGAGFDAARPQLIHELVTGNQWGLLMQVTARLAPALRFGNHQQCVSELDAVEIRIKGLAATQCPARAGDGDAHCWRLLAGDAGTWGGELVKAYDREQNALAAAKLAENPNRGALAPGRVGTFESQEGGGKVTLPPKENGQGGLISFAWRAIGG